MTQQAVYLITGAAGAWGSTSRGRRWPPGTPWSRPVDPQRVAEAVGASDDLLAVRLDITDPASSQDAVRAAVDRFGPDRRASQQRRELLRRVLREEITPDDFRAQIETNLFATDRAAQSKPVRQSVVWRR